MVRRRERGRGFARLRSARLRGRSDRRDGVFAEKGFGRSDDCRKRGRASRPAPEAGRASGRDAVSPRAPRGRTTSPRARLRRRRFASRCVRRPRGRSSPSGAANSTWTRQRARRPPGPARANGAVALRRLSPFAGMWDSRKSSCRSGSLWPRSEEGKREGKCELAAPLKCQQPACEMWARMVCSVLHTGERKCDRGCTRVRFLCEFAVCNN